MIDKKKRNKRDPADGLTHAVAMGMLSASAILLTGCSDDGGGSGDNGASLKGTAVYQTGDIAAQTTVVMTHSGGTPSFQAITNDEGAFTFNFDSESDLPAGSYTVSSGSDTATGQTQLVYVGDDISNISVTLQRLGSLIGQVSITGLNAVNVSPEHAKVTANGLGSLAGVSFEASPSAGGLFSFNNIPIGDYEVIVTAANYGAANIGPFTVERGLQTTTTTTALVPSQDVGDRGIVGVVIDNLDNQPLAGATVVLNGGEQTTVTDAHGAYTFTDVVAGEHVVVVTADGFSASYARFTNEGNTLNSYVFNQDLTHTSAATAISELLLENLTSDNAQVDNGAREQNIGEFINTLISSLPIDENQVGTVSFIMARSDGMIQGTVAMDIGGSAEPVEGATVLVYRTSGYSDINLDNTPLSGSGSGETIDVYIPASGSDHLANTASTEATEVLVGSLTTDATGDYSMPVMSGLEYRVEVLHNSGDVFGGLTAKNTVDLESGDIERTVDFLLIDNKKPYITGVMAAGNTLMDEGQIEADSGFSGDIVFTFNEPMKASAREMDKIKLLAKDYRGGEQNSDGVNMPFTAAWDVTKTMLTITPASPLPPSVNYEILLAGPSASPELNDQSGNAYTGEKERRDDSVTGQSNAGNTDGGSTPTTPLNDVLMNGILNFQVIKSTPDVLAMAAGNPAVPACAINAGAADVMVEWEPVADAVEYIVYASTGSAIRKVELARIESGLRDTVSYETTLTVIDTKLAAEAMKTVATIFGGANTFDDGEKVMIGIAPVSQSGAIGATSWVTVEDNAGPALTEVSGSLQNSAASIIASKLEKGDTVPVVPGLTAWADGIYVRTSQLGDEGNGFFRFNENFVGNSSDVVFTNGALVTKDGDIAFSQTNIDDGTVTFTRSVAGNDAVLGFQFTNPELIDTGDQLALNLTDENGNTTCTPVYFVDDKKPEVVGVSVNTTAGTMTVTLSEPVFASSLDDSSFVFTEFFDIDMDGENNDGGVNQRDLIADNVMGNGTTGVTFTYDGDRTLTFPYVAEELKGAVEVKFYGADKAQDLGFNNNTAAAPADGWPVALDPVAPMIADVQLYPNKYDHDADENTPKVAILDGNAVGQIPADDLWKTVLVRIDETLDLTSNDAFETAAYTFSIGGTTYTAQWTDGGDGVFQNDESTLLAAKPAMFGANDWIKLTFKDDNFFAGVVSNTDTLSVSGINDLGGNAISAATFALTDTVPPKVIDIAASEGPNDAYDIVTLIISEELSASASAKLLEPSLYHIVVDGIEVFVIGTPTLTLNADGTTTVVLQVPEDSALVDANGDLVANLTVEIYDEGATSATSPDFYVLEDVNDNRLGGEDDTEDKVAAADAIITINTPSASFDPDLISSTNQMQLKAGFMGELTLTINFGEDVVTDKVTDPGNWTFPAGVTVERYDVSDADPQLTTTLTLRLNVTTPTVAGELFTLAASAIVDGEGNLRVEPLELEVASEIYDVVGPRIIDIALDDGTSTHDVIVLTVADNLTGPALAVDGDAMDTVELESDSFDVSAFGITAEQISAPLYDPVANTITLYLTDGSVATLLDGTGGSTLTVDTLNTGTTGLQLADAAGNALQSMYPRGNTAQFYDDVKAFVDIDGNLVDMDGAFVDANADEMVPDLSAKLGEASFDIDLAAFVSPRVNAHNFNTALNGVMSDGDPRVLPVQIYFSKELDELTAEDTANYTLPTGFTFFNGVSPQYEDMSGALNVDQANTGTTLDQDGAAAVAGDIRVTFWITSTVNLLETDAITFGSGLKGLLDTPIIDSGVSASDQLGPIFDISSYAFTADVGFGELAGTLGNGVAEVDDPLTFVDESADGVDNDNDGLIDENAAAEVRPEQIDRITFSLNEMVEGPLSADDFELFILTDADDSTATYTDALNDFIVGTSTDVEDNDFQYTAGSITALGVNGVATVAAGDVILDVVLTSGTDVTLFINDNLGAGNTVAELGPNQKLIVVPKASAIVDVSMAANEMDRGFAAEQAMGSVGTASTLAMVDSHTFESLSAGSGNGGQQGLSTNESQLVEATITFDQAAQISLDPDAWRAALMDAGNYTFATADDDTVALLVAPTVAAGAGTTEVVTLLMQVTAGTTGNGRVDIGDSLTLGAGITTYLDATSATVLIPEDNEEPRFVDEFSTFDAVAVSVDTSAALLTAGIIEITVAYNEDLASIATALSFEVEIDLLEYGVAPTSRLRIPSIGTPTFNNATRTMVVTIPSMIQANFGPQGAILQTLNIASELDITGDDDGSAEHVKVMVNTGGLVSVDGDSNSAMSTATAIFPGLTNPVITAVSTTMFSGGFPDDIVFGGGSVGVAGITGGWVANNGDNRADNGLDDDSDSVIDEESEAVNLFDDDGDGVTDETAAIEAALQITGVDGLDTDSDGMIDETGATDPDQFIDGNSRDGVTQGDSNNGLNDDGDLDTGVPVIDADDVAGQPFGTPEMGNGVSEDGDGTPEIGDGAAEVAAQATDGIDNDGDGLIDESAATEAALAISGTDGLDSDGDGLIDENTAADPDQVIDGNSVDSITQGNRNNGLDDDGDDQTDEFGATAALIFAIDGIDNDLDGVIDDSSAVAEGSPEVGNGTAEIGNNTEEVTETDGDDDAAWIIVQDITVQSANGFTGANITTLSDWAHYTETVSVPANVVEALNPIVTSISATEVSVRLFYTVDNDYWLVPSDIVTLGSSFVDAQGRTIDTDSDAFDAAGNIN